ncbi:MAG: ATP synthase F1 subunit delta [Planctomycetes bacterium]|nr:ATP synthase F1 subunit delta [Planctomycetota bacterium]
MKAGAATHLADLYAGSLLELARDSGVVEAVSADLETLATLLTREPGFEAFLASPYFAEQTKRDLVRQVFDGKLHRLTINFLCVAIDHNRGAVLPQMIERYRQLYRAHQGYEAVTVTVAQSLSPEQRDKLAQDLAQAMQAKIDMEVRVDPAILGGVIIRHGDQMLDNSIRGRLLRTVGRVANPENRYKR